MPRRSRSRSRERESKRSRHRRSRSRSRDRHHRHERSRSRDRQACLQLLAFLNLYVAKRHIFCCSGADMQPEVREKRLATDHLNAFESVLLST